MSVNLALVPVAMALRLIMGEKNFRKWIESKQLRVPTKITDKTKLIKSIQKAGYDAQEFGSSIKTHIDGEKEFFFWDLVDGKWCAIFHKGDSLEMIKKIMDEIEAKNLEKTFTDIPQLERSPPVKSFDYPTNFNSEELLMKTLMEYDSDPIKDVNGDIICKIEDNDLRFHQEGDEPYTVQIETASNVKEMFNHLLLLDKDYGHNVQSSTYLNLKDNLDERGLSIESEEVLPDGTMLLTVNIENNKF